VTVDPTFSEGFHQIGDEILDFDPARAIAFYRRALALDPRMDVNHADIAGALSALGRFDEAERELNSVPDDRDRTQWKVVLRAAMALDRREYDKAAAIVEGGPLAALPVFALSDVNALRTAGRADAAYQQARRLVQKNPGYCEAIAALAGLRDERGERAAARQMVAPALRAAETPDVGPAALRCAALSAAAIGDASAAAAALQRIAGDERQLRAWALEITGTTGSKLLRRNMFPWPRVAAAPAVVEARGALERAYATAREQIATALGPITP
jgi:tetratricopeptide (TPR) repeat protein